LFGFVRSSDSLPTLSKSHALSIFITEKPLALVMPNKKIAKPPVKSGSGKSKMPGRVKFSRVTREAHAPERVSAG
jgi:hypothetical protein